MEATGVPMMISVLISVAMGVIGIVSLVCWIMTLVRIFKENVGLGILGIVCALFAFIYGWVKCGEYNNKGVMLVWSAAVVVGILLQVVFGAAMFQQIMSNMPAR